MSISVADTKVGFIGLGIMGNSMAGHIVDAGYDLYVYNRTRAKADDLVARGAAWKDSPGDIAEACDVVITIVGYPADVEAVYLSDGGIVERAKDSAILIDMTTSSPDLASRIAKQAAARGIPALDAPVSGGDGGARAGTLAIMVGGEEAAYKSVMPLFEAMGGKIAHMGGPGAGQHTKMANQIAIASTMMAVCESLYYAQSAGLKLDALLDVIGTGAASSFLLNGLGRKIVEDDYAPGFFVHHFVKDMTIALSEAERMNIDLPGLTLARSLYQKLVDGGFGEEGTQALYRVYSGLTGGAHAI